MATNQDQKKIDPNHLGIKDEKDSSKSWNGFAPVDSERASAKHQSESDDNNLPKGKNEDALILAAPPAEKAKPKEMKKNPEPISRNEEEKRIRSKDVQSAPYIKKEDKIYDSPKIDIKDTEVQKEIELNIEPKPAPIKRPKPAQTKLREVHKSPEHEKQRSPAAESNDDFKLDDLNSNKPVNLIVENDQKLLAKSKERTTKIRKFLFQKRFQRTSKTIMRKNKKWNDRFFITRESNMLRKMSNSRLMSIKSESPRNEYINSELRIPMLSKESLVKLRKLEDKWNRNFTVTASK